MLGLAALTGRRRERRRWLKQRDTCPGVQRIIVTRYGPPEVLRLEEAETPAPAEGEVLVRVARAGINFADLLARMGLYPGVPKPPFVPGHEVAGSPTFDERRQCIAEVGRVRARFHVPIGKVGP